MNLGIRETTKQIHSTLARIDSGLTEQLKIYHDLYPQSCLEAAIVDYRDFCDIQKIQVKDSYSLVNIRIKPQCAGPKKQVLREFLNYLLDLSVQDFLKKT
jgi:hypothetical protein